jgi:hypothetical protein
MLDQWLGERLSEPPVKGQEAFTAIISSAKADPDHPRKAVKRGLIHRGAKVISTEGRDICSWYNPQREGWVPVEGDAYPEDQEE